MKTELLKQLEQAELEKLRIIDRVKELKAQIEEANKEPSIFELMPIGSVWCGWEVVRHDRDRIIGKNRHIGLKHHVIDFTRVPSAESLHKLIAEQRKLDAMKRFAQAALFHCKNHAFNDETLYDAYVEYNLVIEKEDK
jgi:hypothetical protein